MEEDMKRLARAGFLLVSLVLLFAACSEDGGVSSFNFCGQTYNDPGTAHTSLSSAKDFGVMAPGCEITVVGTVSAYGDNFYSGDLSRTSGLYVEMTWTPGNDLDVWFYDEDGYLGFIEGDNSAGEINTPVPLDPGRGYLGVQNFEGSSINYTLVVAAY
jgi:hypothetical protein